MRRSIVLTLLALAFTAGCASSSSSSTSSTSGATRTRRGPADFIPESELSTSSASNAYQAIEMLRPQMLVGRGINSPNDQTGETSRPRAYVDEVPVGSLDQLRSVPITQIKEIRFINARDATTRWGTGHMGGVILVTTRK
jgi:hypothetical protein